MPPSKRPHRTTSILVALFAVCAAFGPSAAFGEPAILVSNQSGHEVLRFHGETGAYIGVHVARGRAFRTNGMDVAAGFDLDPSMVVDQNCVLYIADSGHDNVMRFDLMTGAFIDEFVKPKSGGLGRSLFVSINAPPTCGAVAGGWAVAKASAGGDGQLYVVGKDRDAVLRYGMVASAATASTLGGPCAGILPGDPCPGPLADPNEFDDYGQHIADFIPPTTTDFNYFFNYRQPEWDRNGDLHAATVTNGPAAYRFDGSSGDKKGSAWADKECNAIYEGTGIYVCEGESGMQIPGRGIIGPDGNLYVANYEFSQVCPPEGAAILRFAGPLPAGVNPGDPGDDRGACTGLIEGQPCPGPLADTVAHPDSALLAGGGCLAQTIYLGVDGQFYIVNSFGHSVLRYAGPTDAADSVHVDGPCAGLLPGEPCPGPLGTFGTKWFLPPEHGGGSHHLYNPLGMVFADLPPAGPRDRTNDQCTDAAVLPSDFELTIPFDTVDADTDGPPVVDCTGPRGALWAKDLFGYDVWYQYVAPADGVLALSTVESIACKNETVDHQWPDCSLDTMLAVYGGGASCVCPTDNSSLLSCNDDAFINDAESYGFWGGAPSKLSFPVQAGSCYTIRVGGFDQYPRWIGGPDGAADLQLKLSPCTPATLDCNSNGIEDICDIVEYATSDDCNEDDIPDECQLVGNDCNSNGTLDECDLYASKTSADCNKNEVPDECDINTGSSDDCDLNGEPDECQLRRTYRSPPPREFYEDIARLVEVDDGIACSETANGGNKWCEGFETYSLGSVNGVNGWEGWNSSPFVAGTVTTDANHTPGGTQCLKIDTDNDTVKVLDGYDLSASPYWVLRAWVKIPATMEGTAVFILMPGYGVDSEDKFWSTQLKMNLSPDSLLKGGGIRNWPAGTVHLHDFGHSLVRDEWFEIRVEINLVADTASIFYDGELGNIDDWSIGGGPMALGAIDLYSDHADAFYVDDISLTPARLADCNDSGTLDTCDVTDGLLHDDNGDGRIDECCADPVAPIEPILPEPTVLGKSRYISITPTNNGRQAAIRVTLAASSEYPDSVGESRWVGDPFDAPEEDASQSSRTFRAAMLQCEPHFRDWGTVGLLQVYGGEIVPGSEYAIEAVDQSCADALGYPSSFSVPLTVVTGKFGDVVSPYDGVDPGVTQPDFQDISGIVAKFLADPTAPIKAHAQLQPNVAYPSRPIDFNDIAAAVAAFLGTPYPSAIGAFGPCTCPSTVTCNSTPCTGDAACVGIVAGGGDGLCLNGSCVDQCGRCTP